MKRIMLLLMISVFPLFFAACGAVSATTVIEETTPTTTVIEFYDNSGKYEKTPAVQAILNAVLDHKFFYENTAPDLTYGDFIYNFVDVSEDYYPDVIEIISPITKEDLERDKSFASLYPKARYMVQFVIKIQENYYINTMFVVDSNENSSLIQFYERRVVNGEQIQFGKWVDIENGVIPTAKAFEKKILELVPEFEYFDIMTDKYDIMAKLELEEKTDIGTKAIADDMLLNFIKDDEYAAEEYEYLGRCDSLAGKDLINGYVYLPYENDSISLDTHYLYVRPDEEKIFAAFIGSGYICVWPNEEIESNADTPESLDKENEENEKQNGVTGIVMRSDASISGWCLALREAVILEDMHGKHTCATLYFYNDTVLNGQAISMYEGKTILLDGKFENYRDGGNFYIYDPALIEIVSE